MCDDNDLEGARVHERIWMSLFDEVEAILKDFVRQGLIGSDDYWLVDEDWGWNILQVELPLSQAWPALVRELQTLLSRYRDWRIAIRSADRPKGWPGMGVIVAHDGIIDDLKREYFPVEFRSISFG